nr:hypothetical protein [Bacillus sp. sid0103]
MAKLLRHGLLKASYIPDRNQRELRNSFDIVGVSLRNVQDKSIESKRY